MMTTRRITGSRRRRAGFTLVEVLLVVVIIGILAAVIVPRIAGRTEDARISAAKASIQGLGLAIDQYEVDNGTYPAGLQNLLAKGNELNWKGPYIKGGKMEKDPWGKDYIYTVKDDGSGNKTYEIMSCGANGVEGGGDDIKK